MALQVATGLASLTISVFIKLVNQHIDSNREAKREQKQEDFELLKKELNRRISVANRKLRELSDSEDELHVYLERMEEAKIRLDSSLQNMKELDEIQRKNAALEAKEKISVQERNDERSKIERSVAGQYDKMAEIGRGAFAEVQLVWDDRKNQCFAIKISSSEDEECSKQNVREQMILEEYLGSVNHPHVLQLEKVFLDELLQKPVFVYAYCPYGSLNDYILQQTREGHPVPLDIKLVFMQEIVLAVEYIHNIGIVHLDIKPDNVLLDGNMKTKLTDFGIARIFCAPRKGTESLYFYANSKTEIAEAADTSQTSGISLPKYYIPPEFYEIVEQESQNSAKYVISPTIDIYQIGCFMLAIIHETTVKWLDDKLLLAPFVRGNRGRIIEVAKAWQEEKEKLLEEQMFHPLLQLPLLGPNEDIVVLIKQMLDINYNDRPTAGAAVKLLNSL